MLSVRNLVLVLLAVVALAGVFVARLHRHGPESYIQGLSYPVRCLSCGKSFHMTIAEMNALIKRGEVSKPVPGEMRRFKCPWCGQTNVILDESGRRP